jgi:K+-sensing histidine kinase KdpD
VTVNQSVAGVQLDIEDAGQGMAKLEDGKSMTEFERFDREHAQKPGSSGLGLSIMSKIVEFHGGQMQLRRSSLGGVCISAFFPKEFSSE